MRKLNLFLCGLLGGGLVVNAQQGDRKGHEMKEVWRDMDVPPAPVLSPGEALRTFKLAPGYRIELVAAEPLVEDPVTMTFDADGRLWVVEMRGFMPNVDGKGEDVRNGVIVVLEDTNGDGRMDRRTEFLSGLQMPRSLAMANGGVLVAEPPHLWFCRDTNGDLKCDEKTEVLDNYGLQGPVEHTDNGLLRGLDNWYYNAKSTKRLRPKSGTWALEENFFRGQWGITQDDAGRLYYNDNSNPLYVDLVPADLMVRNSNFDAGAGLKTKAFGSKDVWTGRVNPGINRGYQEDMLRQGHLAVFTAACGPVIYRGDQYPESVRGDAFICEPAGNMIRRQKLAWSADGLKGDNAYDKAEWLTSTDERFRPVNLFNAPDGTLYIVDLYRGILQHRLYVTTFLRKQIVERKLDQPLGLGRIYRVVHEGRPLTPVVELSRATPAEWVRQLSHANAWRRDTAQRLLVDSGAREAVPALRELAASETADPASRLHALWTLEGLEALDLGTVMAVLAAPSPAVRAAGVQMARVFLNQPTEDEEEAQQRAGLVLPLETRVADASPEVVRHLALALSGLKVPAVEPILRRLALERGEDPMVREGVLSGLQNRELEFLQRLLSDPTWMKNLPITRALVRDLAVCVATEKNPYRLARLLAFAEDEPKAAEWRRLAMLDGLVSVAQPKGKGRKPKPVHFDQQPLALAALAKSGSPAVQERLKQLDAFITWGAASAPPPPPTPLTAGQQKLYDTGKMLYQFTCATCHQATGLGEEGKAPPILDSPYLVGHPEVVVGIVVHGVTGPITVHGRTYDMSMPAVQGFDDEQIAAILTYVRREWEHRGDPIEPADVTRIRKELGERETPWTVQELDGLSGKQAAR